MAFAQRQRAALYMRLSRDDGGGESSSIGTQRKILQSYASEKQFLVYKEYVDDGWSGTNFDRPAFKQMLNDIEAGRIDVVITKDLSRLGRDYIATGEYTERYFPERGIRYIAINDGYDSDNEFDDIVPFKNVINEFYAKDTSKKIRSSITAKMKEGLFVGNFAPYGYQKDTNNKNHLIIDPEVAHIVQLIFKMAEQGDKPSQIAAHLNAHNIMPPAIYRCYKHPYLDQNKLTERGEWTSGGICKMLKNVVYMGDTAQGKTKKVSFKSKVTLRQSEDDWYYVRDTHEALVSRETFENVRNRSISRKNPPKSDFKNIFSGIAKCADCGRNMSLTATRKKGAKYNLVCGRYKLYGGDDCTNHFIDYDLLYNIVLEDIRGLIRADQTERLVLLSLYNENKAEDPEEQFAQTNLAMIQKRRKEIDKIISKLYEDNIAGNISNDRFERMIEALEKEDETLKEKEHAISQTTTKSQSELSPDVFFSILDELGSLEFLTRDILLKLVSQIKIHQGVYSEGKRKQKIDIEYRTAKTDP